MTAFNYQWSYERMTQPRVTMITDVDEFTTLSAQITALSSTVDALGSQSTQNAYYQQQPSTDPNLYHPGWQDHQDFSWSYDNQDQFYTPSPSYPPEFLYPPPPQQELMNFEERLTNFIEQYEMTMNNQQVALRNLENQVEQLANALKNRPLNTLPSDTELNPRRESVEHDNAIPCRNGKELHEAGGEKLKRSHDDVEDVNEAEKKRFKNGPQEEEVTFKVVKTIKLPYDHEECFRIDVVKDEGKVKSNDESYFLPMDEDKFGGFQTYNDAKEFKEKTKRRHAMTIFAIEPD